MFRKSLYLMTLPALLLFALFVFFPLIMGYIWYFMLQYPGALNDIRLLFNATAIFARSGSHRGCRRSPITSRLSRAGICPGRC